MSEIIANGFCVNTINGVNVKVEHFLGEGGQGSVYIVNYNGYKKAMIWYKKTRSGPRMLDYYKYMKQKVTHEAPSPEFLWRLDVTEIVNGSFGCIMDIRPEGYNELSDYLLCKVKFKSYRAVINAALQIVAAFRNMHNSGYYFHNIDMDAFLINSQNGGVLICDNDNIAPYGTEMDIMGKPRYMAPEIVLRKNKPNSLSDRFSMSVILYILFCLNHPLEGKRYLVSGLTPALQEKLYGSEPLFIMDPDDNSNGPHPVVHRNSIVVWPCLPDYMQKIFLTAFSQKAFQKPSARPREVDWLNVLTRFRSEIVACQCGNEIFTQQGEPCKCEECGRKANIPFRLLLCDYSIPAIKGNRIYRCQLGTCDEKDALFPVAQVVVKNDTCVWGLQNKTGIYWDAISATGMMKKVAPNEVVCLKEGIIIRVFGKTIKVEANK